MKIAVGALIERIEDIDRVVHQLTLDMDNRQDKDMDHIDSAINHLEDYKDILLAAKIEI